MTVHRRAGAMERRILRTARALGLSDSHRERLSRAFAVGMGPRLERGLDDHHPDFLHPSRTALILMDDARTTDAAVLAAGLVTETRDPSLRPGGAAVQGLGADVAALVDEVEGAGDDDLLLERLLAHGTGAALVAVAERLDHARHLHLREGDDWRGYHHTTRTAYLPLARRTHPALAGRLEWWCATFQERFLSP